MIAAGLGVLLVMGFLNYYYRSAHSRQAEQEYKMGTQLLAQERYDEAIQQFRTALSGEPGNTEYRLALGLALARQNHFAEASVYLNALLKRNPENTLANLSEARILAEQGQTTEAIKLYHRAIDGSWRAGEEQTRLQARFELVALLAKSGQRTQAISELLAALGSAGHDNALKVKIAEQLLGYGAYREAADIFHNVVQTDAKNADAYAGLGQAELAMDNYQDARAAFARAIELKPDEESRRQLELTQQVLDLDPNARGLRAAGRYERSVELLQTEIMRLSQCQPANPALAEANKALASHPRRMDLEDAADRDLMLAEGLWKEEKTVCGGRAATAEDEAIDRVLTRLSTQ